MSVKLRKALPLDEDLIFHWRNLPQIYNLGKEKRPVGKDEHHKWYQKVIESNYENITKFSKDNGADLRFLLNKQKAIEKIEKKERNHSIWINPPQYRNWRNPPQYR